MKKSLISILCGVVILVIGIALFLTTYLQGATGYHSDYFNIGLDEHDHFGAFYTTDHGTYTTSAEARPSQDEQPPYDHEEIHTEIAVSDSAAPTTEWDLADMDSFDNLSLNIDRADVKILTTASGAGKVTFKRLPNVSCYVSSDTLCVETYDTPEWNNSSNNPKVEITLPSDLFLENLSAYLAMGSFSCGGLEMYDADISTDFGTITLKNIKASVMNVTSHCGEIDLEKLECEDLTAFADLGNLEVDGTFGSAYLSVSMGNCEFEGSVGDFTVSNDMGNIEMEITGDSSDHYIDITNDMGEIQVDGKMIRGNSYQCGDSDAPYYGTVQSSMGNVEIEFHHD